MIRWVIRVAVAVAMLCVWASIVPLGRTQSSPEVSVPTVVNQYCIGCHNSKVKAGTLVLDSILTAPVGQHSEDWEDAGTDSEVVEAIAAAMEFGNDPNAVDKNGETAMHAAAYKNVADAVRYLASHGADPGVWNQPNKHGWTPLTIAQGYRFGNFKPSPPTVEALLEVMKAQHVPIKEYKKPTGDDANK